MVAVLVLSLLGLLIAGLPIRSYRFPYVRMLCRGCEVEEDLKLIVEREPACVRAPPNPSLCSIGLAAWRSCSLYGTPHPR